MNYNEDTDSSYSGALRAAGVTVHACKWFGSYQGDWIADVTMLDGRRGLIKGGYGSCSGCDAFEAELGSDYHGWETGEGHDASVKPIEGCATCAEYARKLKAFGEKYLSDFKEPEAVADELAGEGEGEYGWAQSGHGYNDEREQAEFVLARCNAADPRTVRLATLLIAKAPE